MRGDEDRYWKLSAYYFEATTQMESLKHFLARKIHSLSWSNRATSIGNNIAGGLLDSKFQLCLILPNVMAPFLRTNFLTLGLNDLASQHFMAQQHCNCNPTVRPWLPYATTNKRLFKAADVGEDSWESLGLQGDPTSPFGRRSTQWLLWKE